MNNLKNLFPPQLQKQIWDSENNFEVHQTAEEEVSNDQDKLEKKSDVCKESNVFSIPNVAAQKEHETSSSVPSITSVQAEDVRDLSLSTSVQTTNINPKYEDIAQDINSLSSLNKEQDKEILQNQKQEKEKLKSVAYKGEERKPQLKTRWEMR